MGKHYIPQEYLRGFSPDTEQKFIWMFDKQTRAWSRPAIKQAAQQSDYYPPEIEQRLANEIEGPGHRVLNALRQRQTISAADREALAMYIAVLIMRVPRKRRKARELVPDVIANRLAETKQEVAAAREPINSERVDRVLAELSRIEKSYREELPDSIEALIDSPWPSALVLAAVRLMHWRIVDAPFGQYFLTSDNPAHYFDSRGLGNDDAELVVPLSRSVALFGSHQGTAGGTVRHECPSGLLREANRRLSFAAERFVFAPRNDQWIEKIALRPDALYRKTLWRASG